MLTKVLLDPQLVFRLASTVSNRRAWFSVVVLLESTAPGSTNDFATHVYDDNQVFVEILPLL